MNDLFNIQTELDKLYDEQADLAELWRDHWKEMSGEEIDAMDSKLAYINMRLDYLYEMKESAQ